MAENLPDTNVGNNGYIRIQDLIDALSRLMTGQTMSGYTWMYTTDVYDAIASLPSADVVQVRHGKWKYKGVCGIENNIAIRRYKCSECREDIVCDYPYNFCPNCGAKMDARGEE